MRTVFLHIGMPKTGTTTLQFLMAGNKEKLSSYGLLYPESGMSGSPHQKGHHELVRAARNNEHELFDRMISEIECSSLGRVLVSSEEFLSLKKPEMEFVRNKLSDYDVRIVLYLREQASFVESLYNQAVKTGVEKRNRHEFLAEMLCANRLNYYAIVKAWGSVFGKENMLIHKYDSRVTDPNVLVHAFFGDIGVRVDGLCESGVERNRSVDSKYIEFLRCVNKIGIDQELKNEKIVSVLLSSVSNRGDYKACVYGADERRLVRNYCRVSNRMLAKEYLSEVGGDLFDCEDEGIGVVPESLSSELMAEILSLFVVSIVKQ